MARKTTKKKKTKKKTKGLAKKEYTDEEKACLTRYLEQAKRKPLKFKAVESGSHDPTIALQDPDDSLVQVKMFEALGTADFDLVGHLLDQIIQTFKGTISQDGADNKVVVAK
jgi:hypothetical protein